MNKTNIIKLRNECNDNAIKSSLIKVYFEERSCTVRYLVFIDIALVVGVFRVLSTLHAFFCRCSLYQCTFALLEKGDCVRSPCLMFLVVSSAENVKVHFVICFFALA